MRGPLWSAWGAWSCAAQWLAAVARRGCRARVRAVVSGSIERSRTRRTTVTVTRILLWGEEEIRMGALPARAGSILEAVLYRGELPRGGSRRCAWRERPPGAARGCCFDRAPRAHLRDSALASTHRIPGRGRGPMDARSVSGKGRLRSSTPWVACHAQHRGGTSA
jgi:hypothetical protein